jgi:serine/threonine protein kinase
VLGDLGLARNQQNNSNSISAINGTPVYLPPEIVKASKNYTEKIDIW